MGAQVRGLLAVLIVFVALWPTLGLALATPAATSRAFAAHLADSWLFHCVADGMVAGRIPYGDPWVAACVGERAGSDAPYALPFRYPPSALPGFALLALVEPRFGLVVGTAAGLLACLAAAVAWLRPSDLRGLAALAVGIGWGQPVLLNAALGQTGTWLAAACLTLAAVTSPWAVGLALAAVALKPQYGVPLALVLLARGRVRDVGVAVGVTLVLFAAVEAWLGPGVTEAWVRSFDDRNATLDAMATWRALAPALRDPSLDLPAIGLWVVVSLGLALATRDLPRERALAVALPIAAALSPNSHPYDLVIWALPAAAIARDRGLRPELGVLALGLLLDAVWLGDLGLGLPIRWRVVLAPLGLTLGLAAWWGARRQAR